MIADESEKSIQLTLWGANASRENFQIGQVIAVRGARVSDYNGKSLNSGIEHSQIYIDMEHLRTKALKKWYAESQDIRQNLSSISNAPINNGNENQAHERPDNYRLLKEVVESVNSEQSSYSNNNKPRYFKISGFVMVVKNDDKIFYIACPECKKKVQEDAAGYRCEHCNKVFMTA